MAAEPALLRYGGDRSFRPFEFVDEGGKPHGFQVELLHELARLGGFQVEIHLDEWPATEQAFRAGAVDAVAMVDIPSRRVWARFLRSHATPAIGLYRREDHPDPQALTALAGHVVALHASPPLRDTRSVYLDGIGASFIETTSPLASLQAVRDRRADYALMPRAYGDPLLSSGVVGGVVAGSLSLRLQAYAFALAPGSISWQPRLEAALEKAEASGRLEALRVKWLGSHRETAERAALQEKVVRQQVLGLSVAAGGAAALAGLVVLVKRRTTLARAEGLRRQQAEAALVEAEAKLAQSFTRNPDAMLVAELESGRVLDVNDALCKLLRSDSAALLGQRIEDLPALADPDNLRSLRAMLDRDGQLDALPLRVARADGELRTCLVSCELLTVNGALHAFAVLRDVTERLAADETARAGYAALAAELAVERNNRVAAQQSAQRFTTVVAHDLRAPLHTLRGLVGLLSKHLDAGQVAEARNNARQIDVASRRMDAMVAGLGRIAQVERSELRPQHVDMRAMAASICMLASMAHPVPKFEFTVGELPPTHADPELMALVWQQLIDNAWKFTRRTEGAKVLVDSFAQAGRVWYRVIDNGVGFDLAAASRLFVPFQRMHRTGEFPGIGIGLALAHRIVQRHGGELRVSSGVGAGTVVEFTLEATTASPA